MNSWYNSLSILVFDSTRKAEDESWMRNEDQYKCTPKKVLKEMIIYKPSCNGYDVERKTIEMYKYCFIKS